MDNNVSHISSIEDALDYAEAKIRDAGAQAFRAGDDVVVGQARDVVAGIKALRAQLNGQTSVKSPPWPVSPQPEKARYQTSSRKKKKARRGKRSNYPRFEVRNNSLIRIGWSRKDKAEYQHKTSREIFGRTVEAMSKVSQSGTGPFVAEEIIEKTNNRDGPVPNYQAYVVIGLLRDRKCVEQVGREGYMIPEDVSSQAMRAWKQLEEETK